MERRIHTRFTNSHASFFGLIEIRTFVYFPIFIIVILTAWIGIPKKLQISVPIFFIPVIFIRLKWLTMDAKDPINSNVIPIALSMSLMLMLFSLIIFDWAKNIEISSNIEALVHKIAVSSYPVYLFHPLVLYSLKMRSYYLNPNPILFIICYYIQIYGMKILSVSWINHIFDKLTF